MNNYIDLATLAPIGVPTLSVGRNSCAVRHSCSQATTNQPVIDLHGVIANQIGEVLVTGRTFRNINFAGIPDVELILAVRILSVGDVALFGNRQILRDFVQSLLSSFLIVV